jgi:hypothetical protein
VSTRLDHWHEPELLEDVMFEPPPAAFAHAGLGTVQPKSNVCDGHPAPADWWPAEESALFLPDVVSLPEDAPRGAIATGSEPFVSTAALPEAALAPDRKTAEDGGEHGERGEPAPSLHVRRCRMAHGLVLRRGAKTVTMDQACHSWHFSRKHTGRFSFLLSSNSHASCGVSYSPR